VLDQAQLIELYTKSKSSRTPDMSASGVLAARRLRMYGGGCHPGREEHGTPLPWLGPSASATRHLAPGQLVSLVLLCSPSDSLTTFGRSPVPSSDVSSALLMGEESGAAMVGDLMASTAKNPAIPRNASETITGIILRVFMFLIGPHQCLAAL
jgi:hypothetical protein